MAIEWSIERASPVSAVMRIPYLRNADWEQYGLITSDRHLEHPTANIELQRLHLEQAKERDAFILDFGDLFDAMQGKGDRRSKKRDLRREFADVEGRSYLNAIVQYAADFLSPYAKNIALIGKGNHETSVDNKLEYDLHDGLLTLLSMSGGDHIINGGYRGWVRFQFEASGSSRISRNLAYNHGYGGGGPVTKDVIQVNRKAVYLSNADYVFSGHTHDQWWFPVPRARLLDSGREVIETQHHVKIPTYKEEYLDIGDGYHHETGKPPKPVGAWWMRFYYSTRSKRIETQFIPAEV
jgi:hypothetical protein